MTLLAVNLKLGNANRREIAALAGLGSSYAAGSGKTNKRRTTSAGRPTAKHMLLAR
jgi:hypothetical protein